MYVSSSGDRRDKRSGQIIRQVGKKIVYCSSVLKINHCFCSH